MRVLFFGAHFPRPNNTTIGVWALSQVSALRDAGHDIKVISPVPAIPPFVAKALGHGSSADCPPHHNWDGIDVDYVRWPLYPVGPLAKSLRSRPDFWVPIAWTFASQRFIKLAEEFRPDVIFAHHGQFSGYIASRLSERMHVPFLITEHAFGDIESCATNPHRKQHYSKIIRYASRWIAVSKRMERDMMTIFPTAPIATVYNGGTAAPPATKHRPRPKALQGCLMILSVSFFYKRKRVPMLIQAFDAIAERHPEARLVIVGSGDDQPAVTEAARAATHSSQIILCGHLSHAEVLQYTEWCDIFINIAIHEPFATVFADAMAAGKPIIFATDCGITDVAQAGKHGLSVEPDSPQSASAAMDTLLANDALRAQLGANCELLAKESLSWANNASQMTSFFEDATRGNHGK